MDVPDPGRGAVGLMPKRKKLPTDVNQRAAAIVDFATRDEAVHQADDTRDPAAVALGRKGGLKGGKARAEKLTPEQRSEAARRAANARWGKS